MLLYNDESVLMIPSVQNQEQPVKASELSSQENFTMVNVRKLDNPMPIINQ